MGGRPTIRAATPADAEDICRIYAPYVEDSAISFEDAPPDAAEVARRMARRPLLPWLVAEASGAFGSHGPEGGAAATRASGAVLGYCYASRHRDRAAYRWAVDVSVYLAEAARGRGVGRLLYTVLLGELRPLGYVSAYAGITLPNEASVGLHEAMGFRLVGVYRQVGFKHGSWRDVGWWQLALVDPPPPEPAEPREWRPPVR